MSDNILHIDNVCYCYKRSDWKLNPIELAVKRKDFIGIVGSNGSGKSTLLKIAAGILSPDQGSVLLEGKPINKIPRRKLAQKIGYLPQRINTVFDFSVKEVVSMGRFCHSKGFGGGVTTKNDDQIIHDCMNATETFCLRNRTISELSGGERQRVMLASVLAQQPDIMLLDEPVGGLDLHHQISFFKLLSQCSSKAMAVVVITHDLNLASQFCDKILMLNRGQKEIFDSADKVFERISQMGDYSENISILRHPVNQKPAVLPYHNQNKDTNSA